MICVESTPDKRTRLCRCCGTSFVGAEIIKTVLDYKVKFNVCKSCAPVLIHELQRVLDGGEARLYDPDTIPEWIDDGDRNYKNDDLELDHEFLNNMRYYNER